ncbi:MAG: hypothetical protein M0R28_10445 [Pigmentiphaga sp.]|nr:hypothetical protein [Pigmentiphaga sp.]
MGGQALLEGLAALSVLVLLFWAVTWLGRGFLAIDRLAHASRHAAFLTAQGEDAAERQMWLEEFWLETPARWWRQRRHGVEGLPPAGHWAERRQALASSAQPGGAHPEAMRLRPQWQLEDEGLLIMEAAAAIPGWVSRGATPGSIGLRRHTALASGAGYSHDDAHSTRRLEGGEAAWGAAAARSRDVGRAVAERLEPVDRAWSRPSPRWDWVASWQARRPAGAGAPP